MPAQENSTGKLAQFEDPHVPTATTETGVDLYYETEGDGETVVFIGEAGYGAWQWGWQYKQLTGPYETLVWDLRGTGQSDNPEGPYDIGQLAGDLETVLAASETRTAHLIGVGLGGMIALEYASKYTRAETLTLCNTAATGTAVDETALRALQPETKTDSQLRGSLAGGFTDTFLDSNAELLEQICEWRKDDDADRSGFEAQIAALSAFEANELYERTLPTLVCHGLDDPVVPVEAGRNLASELPRGTFEAVEGRHLCVIEHAPAVTDRLFAFLDEHTEQKQ